MAETTQNQNGSQSPERQSVAAKPGPAQYPGQPHARAAVSGRQARGGHPSTQPGAGLAGPDEGTGPCDRTQRASEGGAASRSPHVSTTRKFRLLFNVDHGNGRR